MKVSNLNNDVEKYLEGGDYGFDTSYPVNVSYNQYVYDNGHTSYSMSKDEYYQFGEELLIPEQPTSNFYVYYSLKTADSSRRYYLYEVNIPRGTWKMGHVYQYNLTMNFGSPIFNVEVEQYCDGHQIHSDNIDL